MSKAQKLFNLATTTSNALGVESDLAGHEATKFQADDGANINQTVDEYVNHILVYADLLTEKMFEHFKESSIEASVLEDNEKVDTTYGSFTYDELDEITDLIAELVEYDSDELASIARADWAEQEGEAAMEA